ncbi:uncharacterized protein FFFS_14427 [Fusarium fujikuroi]|nr:uncharacterized protein FFFS_14427 [Fusarium fujikuroi]
MSDNDYPYSGSASTSNNDPSSPEPKDPALSLAPENDDKYRLRHFVNESVRYPAIHGRCYAENGKGDPHDAGEYSNTNDLRLDATLIMQPAVVHPREDWGNLLSHKLVANKAPASRGFETWKTNNNANVSWAGHCSLLVQLLEQMEWNQHTSGEALIRLLVMTSYGMTDIYYAHDRAFTVQSDESFANHPSQQVAAGPTDRRYEKKLLDGMLRVNADFSCYVLPAEWRQRVTGRRFVSSLVYFKDAKHWVSILWDRGHSQLYVFDTYEESRISRIKATVLAWREWLAICGVPYDFDYFAPPLTYQPDSNSCGPLSVRSLGLAVRAHVGLEYNDWVPIPWEIKQPQHIQGQRDLAYALTRVAILEELGVKDATYLRQRRGADGKPVGAMISKKPLEQVELLEWIRDIPQNLNESDMFSRFGGYNHIYVKRLGPETKPDRSKHTLGVTGSKSYEGKPTWRKETFCKAIPQLRPARVRGAQAARLAKIGVNVRGSVPDFNTPTRQSRPQQVIDSSDQSGPPTRRSSPVPVASQNRGSGSPMHVTPSPPRVPVQQARAATPGPAPKTPIPDAPRQESRIPVWYPVTPKNAGGNSVWYPVTPKNAAANPESIGVTPMNRLKLKSPAPLPDPNDRSSPVPPQNRQVLRSPSPFPSPPPLPSIEWSPELSVRPSPQPSVTQELVVRPNPSPRQPVVTVAIDEPAIIKDALYVRHARITEGDKEAAERTIRDLGACSREMIVEPKSWKLPIQGTPDHPFLPTSRTWATFVPAGLMRPSQWDDIRNSVVDAFRPQAQPGRTRDERMAARNRE